MASGFGPALSQQGEGVNPTRQFSGEGTVTPPSTGPTLPAVLVPSPWDCNSKPSLHGGGANASYSCRSTPSAGAGPEASNAERTAQHPAGRTRAAPSAPGSSGRSRSSSAQRTLPQGPASCVPSSCYCSSSCSSPRRDSAPSLLPAKSPARGLQRQDATACRVSGCPRPFSPA